MSFMETRDGTRLFYADWAASETGQRAGKRAGKPVVFVSAWALCAPFWQHQMLPLCGRGLRCVAYDRRGHGRSDDPGCGYDVDTLVDDLAALMDHLDLRDATLVAHSNGGWDVVRYLTRHGTGRVGRAVFIGTSLPCLMKAEDNPDGLDPELVANMRRAWLADFPKWLADNARPFVLESTSQATVDWICGLMTQSSAKARLESSRVNIEIDYRPELRQIRIPALFIHGDADVSNPLEITSRKAVTYLPGSRLEVYEGAPHGLPLTHAERLNEDLLTFID